MEGLDKEILKPSTTHSGILQVDSVVSQSGVGIDADTEEIPISKIYIHPASSSNSQDNRLDWNY